MYNTLMGVCAGAALLLVPRYLAALRGERLPLQLIHTSGEPRGWAAAFGVLGAVLTGLGFVMTVTHPLAPAKTYIDTIFGEPSLILGVLLLAAAWHLAHTKQPVDEQRLPTLLAPASLVVFCVGLILTWCTAAIVRFDVISSAPAEEPITGLLHQWPIVENTFFAAVLYGPAALGCLLFPAAAHGHSRGAWLALYWCFTISGIAFVLFSAMNFYTHTGMLINIAHPGADYRW
ncbi:DUF981 family protein [Actinoplanes sp. NPDC049118]|uniref:DUF981 family protein n=1 Tax=Actinoplanes sp. NPDC049118 TaxID=3155769 RepID=UPI0033E8B48E